MEAGHDCFYPGKTSGRMGLYRDTPAIIPHFYPPLGMYVDMDEVTIPSYSFIYAVVDQF
jgi:hypothetical protein